MEKQHVTQQAMFTSENWGRVAFRYCVQVEMLKITLQEFFGKNFKQRKVRARIFGHAFFGILAKNFKIVIHFKVRHTFFMHVPFHEPLRISFFLR